MAGVVVCPTCGEALRDGAAWRRLRDVPGALPAYLLSHRRAGGKRCATVRGPWVGDDTDQNICTSGDETAILRDSNSRSDCADERATA